MARPRISIEPGRAIVGSTTFTLYETGTLKTVQVEVDGQEDVTAPRRYVSVDGGMSDNARPVLYEADYSAVVANRASAAAPALSRVVGKHCESGDIVVRDVYLPNDVAAGDLLAVPGTGAYCWALGQQLQLCAPSARRRRIKRHRTLDCAGRNRRRFAGTRFRGLETFDRAQHRGH